MIYAHGGRNQPRRGGSGGSTATGALLPATRRSTPPMLRCWIGLPQNSLSDK